MNELDIMSHLATIFWHLDILSRMTSRPDVDGVKDIVEEIITESMTGSKAGE
ncbi:MAG: hypothetical protein AAFQ63_24215 [Cyanobacteria bacterium J06621_11]